MHRFLIVILFCLSALAVWGAFRFDESARDTVLQIRGKHWNPSPARTFHRSVRRYGDWPWLMLAGGLGIAAARVLRSAKWQRILIAAMLASTLAGLTVNLSRLTTGRARPSDDPRILPGFHGPWYEGRLTIGDHTYNSFPSGHTATAFGFAGVILYAAPLAGVPALAIAALIGASSMMVGAHHFSDVTVSIIISLLVAWFTWRWVEKNGDEAWRRIRHRLKRERKN